MHMYIYEVSDFKIKYWESSTIYCLDTIVILQYLVISLAVAVA